MAARGFTLVELVLTMLVLALLASGISSYLGFGARLYRDAAEREQILGQSRFVIERLVRELRHAAPNSVRVHGVAGGATCLEFTPIRQSGVYRKLPVYPESGTDISLQMFNWHSNLLGLPLVVYPTEPNDYYAASNHRVILDAQVLNPTELGDTASGATIELRLSATHSFAAHSPEQRFFILDTAVSYCAQQGEIRRYSGHNFGIGLPQAAAGVVMAQQLQSAGFTVFEPVLNRNAVVNLFLQFGSDIGSDMFFNYEVHLANVP